MTISFQESFQGEASLVAQSVKNLPAVQETRVRSLSWEDPLEKEMATYSSILAWKISWTEESGGLQSMGSQSWARLSNKHLTSGWGSGKEPACRCRRHRRRRFSPWVRKIPWRRKWQPTPAFLPGESHGQRSLVGYSPQGRRESDTTKGLSTNECTHAKHSNDTPSGSQTPKKTDISS